MRSETVRRARQVARGSLLLVGLVLVVGASGCQKGPSSSNPIPSSTMQGYDSMMKSGGLKPTGGATPPGRGSAPMAAPRAGAPMPGAPGTGAAPMAAPTAAPMTAPTAPR